MFSSTTIASSMTMPTESVSASIVIMLSVKPMYQTRPNVAMIEVGIAHEPDVIAGGQRRLHFFEPRLHLFDDLDRVGARLAAHLEQHRAGPVDVGDRLGLGFAVLDAGDL